MSDIISGAELTSIQDEVERYLTDVCDIYRVTETPDNYGGETEVWALSSSTLSRVSAGNISDTYLRLTQGTVLDTNEVLVTLPFDADVTSYDRLYINSIWYVITGVVKTTLTTCKHLRCITFVP